MKLECNTCKNQVELDLAQEYLRDHRVRRGGPWCGGSGRHRRFAEGKAHDESCEKSGQWYVRPECRAFSTDGTKMGALIAHSFGTTDEDEIAAQSANDARNAAKQSLTGMDAEQADWDSEE